VRNKDKILLVNLKFYQDIMQN